MSKDYAVRLLRILDNDRTERLNRLDAYLHGRHDAPYMPDDADAEYQLLAQRCVSNWIPLVVDTPAQALYVDGVRRGTKGREEVDEDDPEWDHWQHSRLDARQSSIYRGALAHGHAFTLSETRKGEFVTVGLSALKTAALFDDPANDIVPVATLTVTKEPELERKGEARMWIDTTEFLVRFGGFNDAKTVSVAKVNAKHKEHPITRFAAHIDLEGRTIGVIEPMIPLQNRINQTVFDLLMAQTYGSFKVRTVTGMAPPMKTEPVLDPDTKEPTGELKLMTDEHGRPIPDRVRVSASRLLFSENEKSTFGTLDHTPLEGYINSIDMSIRHFAAISQTPPHHLLGQIANLSAEALNAAEQSLARKVTEFRQSFGESWERVFRLAALEAGNMEAANDAHAEVLWRDVEARSMAVTADALLKLHELGIPTKGLMRRIPGVTQTELQSWETMIDENPTVAVGQAISDGRGRRAGRQSSLGDSVDTGLLLRDEVA